MLRFGRLLTRLPIRRREFTSLKLMDGARASRIVLAVALIGWAVPAAAQGTSRVGPMHPRTQMRGRSGGVHTLAASASPMVLIPRGTFEMGSKRVETQLARDACKRAPLGERCAENAFANELAAHLVTLPAFWIDRTEVTVAAYARCVEAGPCSPPPYDLGGERFRRDELPVSFVGWIDASEYCRWAGKRLPTEAEWERAARGPRNTRFPWGDHSAGSRANHGNYSLDELDASDGFAELAPVGSYRDGRTPEGLLDMSGNVAEWVADVYEDAYEAMPVTSPRGPALGAFRVVRGGGYVHGMPWLRGAARMYRLPNTREGWLGFRCASDTPQRW